MRNRWAIAGILAASCLCGLGIVWAFERGGNDFNVFYFAWKLVLEGRGSSIYAYAMTPDRFLYAPGFAWILSPFALLPRNVSLLAWSLAKVAVLGGVIHALGRRVSPSRDPLVSFGISAWAVVLLAKPVLIDFQYGQVNLFILGACVWGVLSWMKPDRPMEVFFSWILLAFAGISKIFPLPLLLLPVFGLGVFSLSRSSRAAVAGSAVGAALTLAAPWFFLGSASYADLFSQWRVALAERGFPTESHNQSFAAFLDHYFTGNPLHVVSEGPGTVSIRAFHVLGPEGLSLLSLGWSFIAGGVVVGAALALAQKPSLRRASLLIGSLILPMHLVWKPYFVLSLPLAVLLVHHRFVLSRGGGWLTPAVLFLGINLTGFDVLGHALGLQLEAGSIFFFMNLILLASVYRQAELQLCALIFRADH